MGIKRILEQIVAGIKDVRQLDPGGHAPDISLVLSLVVIFGVYILVAYRMGFRNKALHRRH